MPLFFYFHLHLHLSNIIPVFSCSSGSVFAVQKTTVGGPKSMTFLVLNPCFCDLSVIL
jgi:hypothetical protein